MARKRFARASDLGLSAAHFAVLRRLDSPRKIQAFVNGKLVQVLRGRFARSGKVNLEKLRSNNGTFDVSIVAFFKHGVRRVSTRTYHQCTKTKPHIKKKRRRHR